MLEINVWNWRQQQQFIVRRAGSEREKKASGKKPTQMTANARTENTDAHTSMDEVALIIYLLMEQLETLI